MTSRLLLLSAMFFYTLSASAQISKSDMLKKIDNDQVSFQRAPLMALPGQVTKQLLERTKARHSNFKESMWYYQYVINGGYYNIVFYDWTNGDCLYFTFKQDSLQKKNDEIVNFVKNPETSNGSAKREKIPVKYCEKLYNFYSDKKE